MQASLRVAGGLLAAYLSGFTPMSQSLLVVEASACNALLASYKSGRAHAMLCFAVDRLLSSQST
jgi:hypothetical protein